MFAGSCFTRAREYQPYRIDVKSTRFKRQPTQTRFLNPIGLPASKAGEHSGVSYLSARWTLSSTASGQDVPGHKSDDDDRRRDRDDGDGGGGYDHVAILAFRPASKPRR
jgi:hypothetical protein